MATIPTKFAGPCSNCKIHVPNDGPEQGFAHNDGNGWRRFCRKCVPTKIEKSVRRLTVDGFIEMPYEPQSLDLLRAIPGAKFQRDRSPVAWKVSMLDGDRMRLLEIADKLKLDVPESLRPVHSAEAAASIKAGLYPFQVFGVDWISKGQKRLLGDDMGLGKTVQVLAALSADSACLVICPSSVKYNWAKEARKWAPELKVEVLNGRGSFRFPKAGEIVITNFDTKGGNDAVLPAFLEPKKITPTSKRWEVEVKWPNAEMKQAASEITLVVDEAQNVKKPESGRSKRVNGLARNAKRVWALTGTPLENRPQDLYGMLDSLCMAYDVFSGWNNFVRVMNGIKGRFGGYEWGKPQPIVPELLRRVMLRRIRSEVLTDLPGKTRTDVQVDVGGELAAYLDDMWSTYGERLDVDVTNRQLPDFEEFSTLRRKMAEDRIPTMIKFIEEHEAQNIPLVVFSDHVAPLDAAAERDGWEKITGQTSAAKRQEIVDRFQAGELKGVACSIRAAGIGITLTHAWKMLFVDLNWVPGANNQAEDRCDRIGQNTKVEIVRFVSNHVLDIHIHELLTWKQGVIEAAVNQEIAPIAPTRHENGESETEYTLRMKAATGHSERFEADQQMYWDSCPRFADIPF